MRDSPSKISIYINWPFYKGKSKFNEEKWLEDYLKNLQSFRPLLIGKRLKSIYFGGGDSSLIPIKMTEELIKGINDFINITGDMEVTIEVNPGLITEQKLKDLKTLGINRVSITTKNLCDLEINTIELADRTFDNYSFDLFYARPSQTLKDWQAELKKALGYVKHHVSIQEATTSDLGTEMFKASIEILESNSIYQYEISHYAFEGKESVHNLGYYNYDEYLGIGPGAQSRVIIDGNVAAISIEKRPQVWLERLTRLSDKQVAYEYIMMNLRKANGFNRNDFYIKFNKDIYGYLDHNALKLFQKNGWLQYTEEKVFVTRNGRIFLDKIVRDVIKDDEY